MNTRLYKYSHNLMIPMHRTFNDAIVAHFLVITKHVVISYIKEYRWPIFRPPRDVIGDVIIMKNTVYGIIWGNLFIYEVKLKLCFIFQNFQNAASRQTFSPEVIPKVEYTRKIAISISDILSFWSTNIEWDISISKFDLLCDLVTSSMMSWMCET